MITAVAVVAVCGYWFASSFVSTLLAGNAGLASAAATTGNVAGGIFSTVSGWLGAGFTAAGQFLGSFFTTLFPSLASTTAAAPAAVSPAAAQAAAQAAGSTVGTVVAGATAAIGGLFAIKKATALPILTVTGDTHAMAPDTNITAYQATKTALKSSELAHHAAEHAHHQTQHARPGQGSWAGRMDRPPSAGASIAPRHASFTEQVAREEAAAASAALKR
jgi:hypothetical protein